jgi:hypothetical protein
MPLFWGKIYFSIKKDDNPGSFTYTSLDIIKI